MSEHLTHIAVYEDCARLVLNTKMFCEAFRTCISNYYDSGMLASGARGNHLFAVPILESYQGLWGSVKGNKEAEMQIAGAIGWITHRASDLQMKPTWRTKKAEDPSFPDSEMQVYHDAVTFREVYSGGKKTTRSPYVLFTPYTLEKGMASHPASEYINVAQVEELVTFLYQKEFVELHQFHKSEKDMDRWLDDFIEYHQEFTEDLRMYIEAFTHPYSAKMETYIHGINFYNQEDPLIRWLRGMQYERDVSAIDLMTALDQADKQSQYAQAIRKGYIFLSSASEFFQGNMEKDRLYDILDIHGNNRL